MTEDDARRIMTRFNADAGNLKRYLDRKPERNATIERCARVADEYANDGMGNSVAKVIAATIRALKDA